MENVENTDILNSFTHQSLQQDFDLLTSALDASISGIIITDHQLPDDPIIYCNKAFEILSGYQRSEIIGRNCRFLQLDDRNQPERAKIKETVEKGQSSVVEIRNYKKDGTLFWNELYISPINDAHGNVTHFIGVQNDVTRRKKAESELVRERDLIEQKVAERTKSLLESQDYMDSIIQTVRESLVVLGPDLKVLSVNEHFLRTFKVNRSETEGKILYDLGNGQWDIPKLKELLEGVLPTNNPVLGFEVEHDFPHIGTKLMLLNAHRIEFEGQYKDRILIAIEDITERRSIEKRKDDFLSIASHELKTPLTTIKGYVQIMNRLMPDAASDKFKEVVAKTGQFVERLSTLIAELLDVNRIQTGNLDLQKQEFNFDQMVDHAVEGIQAATVFHKITIEGETIGKLKADELHLTQVMTNLLSNAVKYAPDASVVRVYKSLVSNYVRVSVHDSGIGIAIDDQKRIFERFYRATDIQKKFPGMGIGLYFCAQIVQQHGGSLWVESEKGKGSVFSFTLPVERGTA
jgi:PAS domain S-box-containing protein